ncbi:MAG: glycosyltransferase [Acidobacteria bacterium]|nr:glycosyltransferase [Acidobacteriota bacterium]
MDSAPMTPFISVIVPFYNNRAEIGRCCASLLRQTYPKDRFEILFIDNNSTDNSASIVAGHPGIQLLWEASAGAYAARNQGIRKSKGEILVFTEADCVVAPDWLSQVANAMQSEIVQIVMGAYFGQNTPFPAKALSAYENAKNRYIFTSGDESLYYGYTNNMAVRRGVFDQFGFFPEIARGGDVALVRRVVDHGGASIKFVPTMFVDHLEFQSVLDYYRKVYIHSRSVRRLHSKDVMRPLTSRERLNAFNDMVRAERYSPLQALFLRAILAVGMLFWVAGWLVPLPQQAGPQSAR